MDRINIPTPIFTQDELKYLQIVLTEARANTFNFYMMALEQGTATAEQYAEYQIARAVRDKVYHLGGRDTLAPGPDYHEQRWDQPHDIS